MVLLLYYKALYNRSPIYGYNPLTENEDDYLKEGVVR